MKLKKRIWPPTPYWGGKHYAVPTLMKFVPDDTRKVISPFFGGGALEATLAGQGVEVEGGDIFEPIAEFWDCAINHNWRLQAAIRAIGHPDKARWVELQKEVIAAEGPRQAAICWLVLTYSFAGMGFSGGGYFSHPHKILPLAVDKLKRFEDLPMSVRHASFVATLEAAADNDLDALVYADPPYDKMEAMYGHKRAWDAIDHDELAYYLAPFDRWILTIDPTPKIKRLYRGAYWAPLTHFNPAYSFNHGSRQTARDIIIMSPGVARSTPRLVPLNRLI